MTRKKGKGWTFLFSLLPGAGEMYMGFMKQGVSIMGLFFTLIAFAAWLNIGPVLIVLPIIWCYSFFNVHNINGLSDEEFYALEDNYILHFDRILPMERLSRKQNKILAYILIFLGICILWEQIASILRMNLQYYLPTWITNMIDEVLYTLPQILVGLIMVGLGIRLIKGKKVQLDKEEKEG